jgi:hypothetical protein
MSEHMRNTIVPISIINNINITPIIRNNNYYLRQQLSLVTNFVTQNWARLCRSMFRLSESNPH